MLQGPRGFIQMELPPPSMHLAPSFQHWLLGTLQCWDRVWPLHPGQRAGSLADSSSFLGFRVLSPSVSIPLIYISPLLGGLPLSFPILSRGSELLRRLSGPQVTSKTSSYNSQLGYLGECGLSLYFHMCRMGMTIPAFGYCPRFVGWFECANLW